ncbi:beta-1,6-N-acetylglucosaminyltransferase [Barnesiella sp. WM24]|uniref:beta-1,6-N-acetylglucosaminyltransferase n=1 Tax=Barnesiella sp. WM24 TaxID=2558278 RepID=UPI001431DF4A|nr:beta-1,6-N-acetylglucosaminyltransferase [Barnesiella sp. WM24]
MSQIQAELLSFKTAIGYGEYDYIHLLSGQDLPLNTQDYIHRFFDSLKKGTNLIGFAQGEFNRQDLALKTNYYHFFIDKYRYPIRYVRGLLNIYRDAMVSLQKRIGLKRRWNMKLYKGCNWVSITPEFARYLVDKEHSILKMFRWVPCADEIYKQTLMMESPYKHTVYSRILDFAGMTRKTDWTRGCPYTWHEYDFQELITSDALFARKFSSNIDKKIIDKISNHILLNGRKEATTDKDTRSLPQS